MSRVKRGNVARQKRKKIIKANKGHLGTPNRLFRSADRAYLKAGKSAYRDRRLRRRSFRRLWIVRLNAATRQLGIRYSTFISLLNKSDVQLDRKQLADLAFQDFPAFQKLVEYIQQNQQPAQAEA